MARGLLFAGGWTGENPTDYNGPFKIEADYWDAERRRELADAGDRRSMARYLVDYDLDGEAGHGVVSCFMAPSYQPASRSAKG